MAIKRNDIEGLGREHWVEVEEDPDLKLALIPGEAAEVVSVVQNGSDDRAMRRLCTHAFVDFKGFVDDEGNPEKNTLEARMLLMRWLPVRRTVVQELARLNEAIIRGEDSGASG